MHSFPAFQWRNSMKLRYLPLICLSFNDIFCIQQRPKVFVKNIKTKQINQIISDQSVNTECRGVSSIWLIQIQSLAPKMFPQTLSRVILYAQLVEASENYWVCPIKQKKIKMLHYLLTKEVWFSAMISLFTLLHISPPDMQK